MHTYANVYFLGLCGNCFFMPACEQLLKVAVFSIFQKCQRAAASLLPPLQRSFTASLNRDSAHLSSSAIAKIIFSSVSWGLTRQEDKSRISFKNDF